jgi:5'-methylthioadenosine phosphorylase/purine-nucleoside phosphorylase
VPIHLRARPEDYAPAVLCPGDPLRATLIAETVFDPGARCVNTERGLLGYTGTFRGQPLSVQATGMGCASAGIVVEELVQLGARRLIRVGTCGGLGAEVAMGDLIIATGASCDDTTPLRYAGMDGFAPVASPDLVASARRHADPTPPRRCHIGPVVTSGLFYDPDPNSFARWARVGHLGVEMEAAMIYAIAAVHRVEALTVAVVSDRLDDDGTSERISDEALAEAVIEMITLGALVAVDISPGAGATD